MSSPEDQLRDKTVDELREQARKAGIAGASDMRKEDLVQALASKQAERGRRGSQSQVSSLGDWVRDRSLGLFFISLFVASWIGQLIFEWQVFVDEQREHDGTAVFWSADFWETFWQSTLENWQSEFLQLAAFTIAATYLVMKGSSESPDSSERMEQKLDALLEKQGIDPKQIELQLPRKFQKTR